MSFASPLWLLALLAIPAAVIAARLARRRRRRYALRFPATATAVRAAAAATSASHLRRRVPALLLLAVLALLSLALARPRVPYRRAVGQASLMLVTDHSGSMAATDVLPTRLAAAKRAADTSSARCRARSRWGRWRSAAPRMPRRLRCSTTPPRGR